MGRSGRVRKISPHRESIPGPSSQAVPCRCTDCAIAAHEVMLFAISSCDTIDKWMKSLCIPGCEERQHGGSAGLSTCCSVGLGKGSRRGASLSQASVLLPIKNFSFSFSIVPSFPNLSFLYDPPCLVFLLCSLFRISCLFSTSYMYEAGQQTG